MSLTGLAMAHEACGNYKCIALQNDLLKYKTRHHFTGCSCEELMIDITVVDQTLRDGYLPLLQIAGAESLSTISAKVVPSQYEDTWVAISHVWADGLGNPARNALPRCQLQYLDDLARRFSPPTTKEGGSLKTLLWLDTLCCPVSPEDAKKRALSEMKRTYQEATFVLVVESSLRLHESRELDTEETWARILSSGWMRRLWTLQEGAFGVGKRRLYFQFRDKAVSFHDLRQSLIKTYNTSISRKGFAIDLMNLIEVFVAFVPQSSEQHGPTLKALNEALHFRSVSVADDEPLLLGNMLGIEGCKILDGPRETRMHRMWSSMPSASQGIPKTIIFRLGPRLQGKGFGWAPATMMQFEETNMILPISQSRVDEGKPTQRGLLVHLAGFSLSMAERPKGLPSNPWNLLDRKNDQTLYVRDAECLWYILIRRLPTAKGDFLSAERLDDLIRHDSNIWIVHLETDFRIRRDGDRQKSTGLLTKLVETEGNIMYVQSTMHVDAALVPNALREILETAYLSTRKLMQSSAIQMLSETSDQDVSSEDLASILDTIKSNIHALATADFPEGRGYSQNLFEYLLTILFIGQYGHIATRLPGDQQWCVD